MCIFKPMCNRDFSKAILPAKWCYEKGQCAILPPSTGLWRKERIHHPGLSRILAGPIFPPQFSSLGVERNMAACCLYHLNWYKSQLLQDQDEMRPENRLWPHELRVYDSQERFKTDRYDTGLYSTIVNITHRHTEHRFLPCKAANHNKSSQPSRFLSYFLYLLMENTLRMTIVMIPTSLALTSVLS